MQYAKLIRRDGQPYSEIFDDIYYSSNDHEQVSGESEFQHVFFRHNGLPGRWSGRDNFVIAELGFGSGLNCILTIREWLKHNAESNEEKTLHYIAIEKYPLSVDSISELISRYPDLKQICEALLESYPPAVEATHCRRLFNNQVVIHYKFMDVHDALDDCTLNVDAWFLDGFSPAKNPAMWAQDIFVKIANNSSVEATCSTYTAAGFVKRNLQSAGFVVSKVKGHGNKREMLVAKLPAVQSCDTKTSYKYNKKPWYEPPPKMAYQQKNATILGAGIAGLSLAYELVQRGWTVTIIDKPGGFVNKTSSNPAPIIYPRLSINNDVDTEFFISAYCYAIEIFKSLQKKSQQKFWFDDGLLQLIDEKRITQIINKFQFNDEFVSITDEVEINKQQAQVVVNYASAGVLLPEILCDVIKAECADNLSFVDAEITEINYDGHRWHCLHDTQSITDSEVLIIANGTGINNLGLSLEFPVESIRGQVVALNECQSSRKIRKTLNADIHITPAINGKHYLGASYTRNSESSDINLQENHAMLTSLCEIYPDMFDEAAYSDTWLGFRSVSKDRVPIIGAVPDEAFFNEEYADICHGSTTKTYRPAAYLKGLYISAAHGSRGFTSSFIAADIISSLITGEPSPVNKKILDYLSPSRFIVNNLKRR